MSTVAHELRSPLTSVKGFTATLLNKWGRFTDDQKRVMLETVNADADRVTRLITELLDVSRIESGRMEVHRQLVDLPDRARRIIAGRVAAGDAEDRFRLEVLDGLPETWLDADKIDQILGNLVENAVRHGAGIVTIVVEPARLEGEDGPSGRPDAAAVSVRDQGEGISPDVAPRVFRQFWRGKPRGGSRRAGTAAAPAWACTSSRAWSRRTAARSACAARPAAAPSSDLSCPRGRLPPEGDTLTGTRVGAGAVISLRAIQRRSAAAARRRTLQAGPTLTSRRSSRRDAATTPVRRKDPRPQTPAKVRPAGSRTHVRTEQELRPQGERPRSRPTRWPASSTRRSPPSPPPAPSTS